MPLQSLSVLRVFPFLPSGRLHEAFSDLPQQHCEPPVCTPSVLTWSLFYSLHICPLLRFIIVLTPQLFRHPPYQLPKWLKHC